MILEKNLMYQENLTFSSSENIVLGSEICPVHLLKQMNKEIINVAARKKKQIRFVTPIVPQKYIDEIYDVICSLPANSKVTFNDYGLLYKCRGIISSNRLVPVLGRIITHSLIDCPWYESIVKYDNQYMNILKRNNMDFASKIEFMRDLGIKEIEVNNCPQDSLANFHKNGIGVVQYSTYNILSVSRTCFYAKFVDISTTDCYKKGQCSSLMCSIKMTDYYSNRLKLLIPNDHSVIDWNNVAVFGTALFIKNNSINENVDYLIV